MSSHLPEHASARHAMSSAPPPVIRDRFRSGPPGSDDRTRRTVRLAIRLGLLAVVLLVVGRCSLGVTDRPRFLGLATAARGADLREATRVVIVLHGYGADKDDLARLAPEVLALGAPEYTTFVHAEGPYRAGLGGRAWWTTTDPNERADSIRRVNEVIDGVLAKTGLSSDRVYLTGFSQGAALALEIALSRPDRLGGFVAFSACRGNTPWGSLAQGHAPVRGVMVHGHTDRVCPFSGGSGLQEELARAGHQVRLVAFDGPHSVTTEGETALASLLRGDAPQP
jgi:phospholipase/carboxylesterase